MGFQKFERTLQIDGRQYSFHVGLETVDLGPAGEVDYVAFDGGDVRQPDGGINGKTIVDAWWALCQNCSGTAVDLHDREHLLKAWAYLRLCTHHAIQDVYRCSYLGTRASRQVQLERAEIQHLKNIVARRDITLIRQALEACLLMDLPPQHDLIAYQRASAKLTGLGHLLLEMERADAIELYLERLIPYLSKLRRQNDEKLGAGGRGDRVRRMLNFFSYESLACFHHCAAAVLWELTRGLLPESSMSARFNAFMHDCWRVDTEEGMLRGDHRGLLGGQILSLHPVGRWLLGREDYRHAIGRWIAAPDYGRISPEATLAHPDYQAVLLVLLLAAHEYRHAYEESELNRRPHQGIGGDLTRDPAGGVGLVEPAQDESPGLESELFDELAQRHHVCCNRCDGPVAYNRFESADKNRPPIIHYQCQSCGGDVIRRFTREQVQSVMYEAA